MSEALPQVIQHDISWVKGHVIVILASVALIAGIVLGSISLIEGLVQRHDEHAAVLQQQKEGVATATQAALLTQLQQEHTDNAVRDANYLATITNLVTQMKQEHVATAKQVATDATLDAKSAADRLVTQEKASPSDVTTSNDTVTMTLPLTRRVVQDLDTGAQAQRDVTNLQGQLDTQKILTSDSKIERDTANQVIAADKVELVATIKADNAACKVEIDKQAAKDRKHGIWAVLASIAFGYALHR